MSDGATELYYQERNRNRKMEELSRQITNEVFKNIVRELGLEKIVDDSVKNILSNYEITEET